MFSPLPRRAATVAAVLATLLPAGGGRAATPADVLTYHNDLARTGQQLAETLLTPATVNPGNFGKKFVYPVDGQIYAQPLYVGALSVAGRDRRNAVLVATEHDSVYLFDADGGGLLWQRSFLDPANGVTSVPFGDVFGCGQIAPELGITGTPVIDPATNTAYLVAMTREVSAGTVRFVQRLHALDLASGAERPGSPVEIQASVPGRGDGGSVVTFIPRNYKARPGLALVRGVVYTSWSSHCDAGVYHGWVIGYDAVSLQQTAVFNNTPDGREGSYWASGAAPAADAAGNLYVIGGNGSFDPPTNPAAMPRNVGHAFLKLSTANNALTPADYFAPFNYDALNRADADLGSSGALLYDAPNGRRLLTSAGKEGRLYVLDRDNLGKFHPGSDPQIVQSRPRGDNGLAGGLFGSPAYWNGTVYFSALNDYPKAFRLNADGTLPATPTARGREIYGYPGSNPVVSARGATTDGLVWTICGGDRATLHCFDAADLTREIYNSTEDHPDGRDIAGPYVNFTSPTVAQGRVYVPTTVALVAYGLLAPAPAADVSAQVSVTRGEFRAQGTVPGRSKQTLTLTNTGNAPIAGPLSLVLDKLRDAPATLRNAAGSTTVAGRTGSPYVDVLPPGGSLAPGASVTAKLKFADPVPAPSIRYKTRVLAGPGAR